MTLLIAEEGSMLEDEIFDTILSVTNDDDKMHKNLSDMEVTSCPSLRGMHFLD